MSDSNARCLPDWSLQVENYNYACAASFAFTAMATILYICGLKSRLDGAPQRAAQKSVNHESHESTRIKSRKG